ncbi:glycoside hydrolase [Membranicola marinus]|uniref:Glycoside hydrolase n=1 Tax=Membranihabitans marinus TaxID=1227546 RepID=A0A953HRA2_9BACT|nr:sialidase family protein [Membranihabitans marinus]MBY5956935.1 glycoside hydrolase [Membranihabitans marinus]
MPEIIDKEVVFIDQTSSFRPIPSDPNFRTGSNIPSLPRTVEVPFPWEEEKLISNNQGYITGNVFVDPDSRFILQLMLSTPGTPDTSSGSPQYKTWYRVSTDGGRTFSKPALVVIEGNTLENPIDGVEIGRNGYNVNFTTPIIKSSSGKIIVPVNLHPWDEEKQKIYNPADAYIFQDAGALVGEWDHQSKDFNWRFGGWLRIDHHVSTRGLSEPSIVELSEGRFVMISRGSNLKKPDLPAHAWVSFSDDDCMTWSKPRPFSYSDGTSFHVPASCSTIFRSRVNNKLYWIGNLVEGNPDGNFPRFPIVIGEVNEKPFGIIKDTVLQLDTRHSEKEGEKIQLSNFNILEHSHNGEIIITLTRREGRKVAKGLSWYRIALAT